MEELKRHYIFLYKKWVRGLRVNNNDKTLVYKMKQIKSIIDSQKSDFEISKEITHYLIMF